MPQARYEPPRVYRGTEEGLFIYLNPFPWQNDIPIIDGAKGEKLEFEVPPRSAISLEEIIEFQKCFAGMYGEVSRFSQRVYTRRLSDEGEKD